MGQEIVHRVESALSPPSLFANISDAYASRHDWGSNSFSDHGSRTGTQRFAQLHRAIQHPPEYNVSKGDDGQCRGIPLSSINPHTNLSELHISRFVLSWFVFVAEGYSDIFGPHVKQVCLEVVTNTSSYWLFSYATCNFWSCREIFIQHFETNCLNSHIRSC